MPISPASRNMPIYASAPSGSTSTSTSTPSLTVGTQTLRSSIQPELPLVSPTFDLQLYALQLKNHSLNITGDAIDAKLNIEPNNVPATTLKMPYDTNISEAANLKKLKQPLLFWITRPNNRLKPLLL